MAFNDQQIRLLKAKLDGQHVKTRKSNGAALSYIEGWHAIAEANRIFGFDGWDRRTLFSNCIWTGSCQHDYLAAYIARVRIYVRAGDVLIVREGSGTGEGKAATPGGRTRSRSSPPRRMRPSGPSRPSAMCLALPFTTASKRAFATIAKTKAGRSELTPKGPWVVRSDGGAIQASFDKPVDFVEALKKAMAEAPDIERLFEIWEQNVATVRELNASREELGLQIGFASSLVAHLKSCAVALVEPSERREANAALSATSKAAAT